MRQPLRMSQISRIVDPLQSNYCVLSRIVCKYLLGFAIYCCALINPRKARIRLILAKHSSNTVYYTVYHCRLCVLYVLIIIMQNQQLPCTTLMASYPLNIRSGSGYGLPKLCTWTHNFMTKINCCKKRFEQFMKKKLAYKTAE